MAPPDNGVFATPEIPDITEIEKARLHENAEVEKVKFHEEAETKRLEIKERETTARAKYAKWTSDSFLVAFTITCIVSVLSLSIAGYHITNVVMEHIHLQNK